MAFYRALPWHAGEDKIHQLTRVPQSDNPTHPMLSGPAARRVAASPLIALGTTDSDDNVWCTVWGGDLPIAQQVASGVIGVKALVDASFDPVVQTIYGGRDDGEVLKCEVGKGRMVSGLSIHLEERDRVKLFGRMVAGCLDATDGQSQDVADDTVKSQDGEGAVNGKPGKTGMAQLVLHITQSLGNCPKYINKKIIKSQPTSQPRLISEAIHLTNEAITHIHSCDIFFVASRGPEDMDCNHRGGTPGFLRVEPTSTDTTTPSTIIWPEYSGNNLYQTLGNILHTPHIALCIPNFITGDVLYLSGTAEILIDDAANQIISKTKLAVRFTVSKARFVGGGLMFRGTPCADNRDRSSSYPVSGRVITDGMSPYNPRIRYLTSEGIVSSATSTGNTDGTLTATLTRKTKLTPTITRYTFTMPSPSPSTVDTPLWTPSQYVALDFSEDLYMGYSHMRDDEPTSLNDDFVRTFTVASQYVQKNGEVSFDIMVRNVGVVTRWLGGQNERSGLVRVGVLGFGGGVKGDGGGQGTREAQGQKDVFVAAGIGITPLLGRLPPVQVPTDAETPASDMHIHTLLWTLHIRDITLASSILPLIPLPLRHNTTLFVTGTQSETVDSEGMAVLQKLEGEYAGSVRIERRRVERGDVIEVGGEVDVGVRDWVICVGKELRGLVSGWIGEGVTGGRVVVEDFGY